MTAKTPPKVLLVTPYSPAYRHGHAADDIAANFYTALGRLVDLTVAAPVPDGRTAAPTQDPTYKLVRLSPPRFSARRLLGLYPAAARKDWSRDNTREVKALMRSQTFTNVHVEYMQPLEVLSDVPKSVSTSLTLHDIGTVVSKERAGLARGALRTTYFTLDHWRIARLESRSVKVVDRAFALSNSGCDWLRSRGARGAVLELGRSISQSRWTSRGAGGGHFVFAGALWREANQLTLQWLLNEVLPRIPRSAAPIGLRVIGSGAPDWLIDLCKSTPAVDYVGEVDSFEEEYVASLGVLAPTVVSAGILLKAQKALECGAPLLLNTLAAEPLQLDQDACIVADTPEEFARAMIRVAEDDAFASRVAKAGHTQWVRGASWDDSARAFATEITRSGA
ncbi:glycosyltransferase [Microbacterium oleivorans]|uniref:glycosyltransferase n=1 Tax=Microbacterium oleivorans TaxID=273677 RepID=UPI0010A4E50B|nr:glycosyltransferase [Microbacterium oleivorans]THE08429.1 glycosyltransferase [Microbacterium oleivorans]